MTDQMIDPKSKLSAWIPKDVHKQAKVLATLKDIDLQDVVTEALRDYLLKKGVAA